MDPWGGHFWGDSEGGAPQKMGGNAFDIWSWRNRLLPLPLSLLSRMDLFGICRRESEGKCHAIWNITPSGVRDGPRVPLGRTKGHVYQKYLLVQCWLHNQINLWDMGPYFLSYSLCTPDQALTPLTNLDWGFGNAFLENGPQWWASDSGDLMFSTTF